MVSDIKCKKIDRYGFGIETLVGEFEVVNETRKEWKLTMIWDFNCPEDIELYLFPFSFISKLESGIEENIEFEEYVINQNPKKDKRIKQYALYIHKLANYIFDILQQDDAYDESYDVWDWVEDWVHKEYTGEYIPYNEWIDDDEYLCIRSADDEIIEIYEFYVTIDSEKKYFGYYLINDQLYVNWCYVSSESILKKLESLIKVKNKIDRENVLEEIKLFAEELMLWRDIPSSKYFYFLHNLIDESDWMFSRIIHKYNLELVMNK